MTEVKTPRVQNPDPLLTVDEAAAYLNTTPRFLRRQRERGRLMATKLGGASGSVRYKQSALDKFVRDCDEGSAGE